MEIQKPMHCMIASLATVLILLGALTASAQNTSKPFDERSIRGYDYTGPYAQFGLSVGKIHFDNFDSDASGGFILGGGYRFLPWLAADANFTFLGGEDNVSVGGGDFDTQYFAFTFGPKIYPLGALEIEDVPHFVQPYALIAIGGGEGEIDGPGAANFERSGFVARFILGLDVWATDHIGFFVEGGGHATDEDVLDGVGIFTFGGQYRF